MVTKKSTAVAEKSVKPVRKKASTPASKPAGVAVGIKTPITFKEFSKDPVKGLLFIVIVAIGYMYYDGKVNYMDQIKKQGQKIVMLETKIELLSDQLRRSDSALSGAISKISVLQELGKIQ